MTMKVRPDVGAVARAALSRDALTRAPMLLGTLLREEEPRATVAGTHAPAQCGSQFPRENAPRATVAGTHAPAPCGSHFPRENAPRATVAGTQAPAQCCRPSPPENVPCATGA